MIREAHPLKQGLKLCEITRVEDNAVNSRGTSTKTRIETMQCSEQSDISTIFKMRIH
ncbi:MAG: hypothetical protein KJ714_08170 [Euryarchaeota archaeon]|nr:hypothetical protein [Euryarchaeota archaeon]